MAAQGRAESPALSIDNAFGFILGEPAAVALALQKCHQVNELYRCPWSTAETHAVAVLVDAQRVVHAVEAQHTALTESECHLARHRELVSLNSSYGQPTPVIFDDWNFRGLVWEQEMDHAFAMRAVSLSECRQAAAASWYFELAWGASQSTL